MYTLQTKLKIFYANAINEKRRKYETTRLDTARAIKVEEKDEEKEEEEKEDIYSQTRKKFPKIALIDPHNVCTKFIVRYNKFK